MSAVLQTLTVTVVKDRRDPLKSFQTQRCEKTLVLTGKVLAEHGSLELLGRGGGSNNDGVLGEFPFRIVFLHRNVFFI